MGSLSKRFPSKGRGEGILAKLSQSQIVVRGREAVGEAGNVAKKLLWSTGRAAWIAGTTFLILVVPLIVEMDREAQMNELEMQQASLLGTPPSSVAHPPSK